MLYMGTQVTIRDVNKQVFREFKADAIKQGLKLGTALTLAMEKFRSELHTKKIKFTSVKPTSWGKGTGHVSAHVDEILYRE